MSSWNEGSLDAPIALVGEAPARWEMKADRCLIGPAGQLLDMCLHNAGIMRQECFLINLFPWEIFKSKDGDIRKDGELLWSSRRGFTDAGMVHVKNLLKKLGQCKANVIVPMGNPALEALCEKKGITKWRGSILPLSGSQVRKCIPTIHPAASLRGQFIWRYFIINDLKKVRRHSEFKEFRLPRREFLIDPSFNDAMAYIGWCEKYSKISFDIEVTNHQVSCISFSPDPWHAISIPFSIPGIGHKYSIEEEAKIWRAIDRILGNPTIDKIGQNLIFDMHFLFQQNHIWTRGKILDTMIAHHIMYPDFPKGLDFLVSIYTDEPYYKDDRKLWDRIREDPETFWTYSCRDSSCTYEVWNAVESELDDGYLPAYKTTVDMFPALIFMMTRGFKVNREELDRTNKRVTKEIEGKYQELKDVADFEFNPGSPKQCQNYFYTNKGITPYISNKTGRPTTDDKALQRIYRKTGLKEAKICQEIRGLEKLKSTYLEVVLDKDGRLRCSYNPRGTRFSRLSSSKTVFGTGLNMQNLAPEFNSFLEAD